MVSKKGGVVCTSLPQGLLLIRSRGFRLIYDDEMKWSTEILRQVREIARKLGVEQSLMSEVLGLKVTQLKYHLTQQAL